MLSVSCKAAIKAVVFLGVQHQSSERYSFGEIAAEINENNHTVGKLLQKLTHAGIINSIKGPNGGFYITEQQRHRHVMDIVEAIDGKEVFLECGLGFNKCTYSKPCPFHNDFKKVRDLFTEMCRKKKICELDESVIRGNAYLSG